MTKRAGVDYVLPVWRGVVVLRLLAYGYALALVISIYHSYAHPGWAAVAMAVMGGWTLFTLVLYLYRKRRQVSPWLIGADLVLTLVLMYSSHWIMTPAQLVVERTPLLTNVWASSSVALAAVATDAVLGALAGTLVAVLSALTRGTLTVHDGHEGITAILVGLVMGVSATATKTATRRLSQALRVEVASAERERLARSIHDGVLQVLARVQRLGRDAGGEAGELAAQAQRQEIALRSLVSSAPDHAAPDGELDLRPGLQVLATPRVEVSVPGTQVALRADITGELLALAREALINVERHAGPAARAWVLLEDLGEHVVLSVRDDGPGIPNGRLDRAHAEGRMGVSRSIRGRVASLGGSLELRTRPGEGTEWEITVPRRAGVLR